MYNLQYVQHAAKKNDEANFVLECLVFKCNFLNHCFLILIIYYCFCSVCRTTTVGFSRDIIYISTMQY